MTVNCKSLLTTFYDKPMSLLPCPKLRQTIKSRDCGWSYSNPRTTSGSRLIILTFFSQDNTWAVIICCPRQLFTSYSTVNNEWRVTEGIWQDCQVCRAQECLLKTITYPSSLFHDFFFVTDLPISSSDNKMKIVFFFQEISTDFGFQCFKR